jgi:hypothetical protein
LSTSRFSTATIEKSSLPTTEFNYHSIIIVMGSRDTKNNDFDKTSRLTAEDEEMCGRVRLDKTKKLENFTKAVSAAEVPSLASFSSTPPPQDTSFLTEEIMKKIHLPKKIEF